MVTYLIDYLSEEASSERLRKDLISQSKLKSSSKLKDDFNYRTITSTEKKIYRIAVTNSRGGFLEPPMSDEEFKSEVENIEAEVVNLISTVVIKFLVYLNEQEQCTKITLFRLIYRHARLALEKILLKYGFKIFAVSLFGRRPKRLIIIPIFSGLVTGGSTALVQAWMKVTITYLGPPAFLVAWAARSVGQQYRHRNEIRQLCETFSTFLKERQVPQIIKSIMTNRDPAIEDAKEILNQLNKLPSLKWEENLALRQAAQRLGIFESPPAHTVFPINTDKILIFDPDLIHPDVLKMLKKYDLIEQKTRTKAKMVNFRDFIREFIDPDDILNSEDVIDVEVIEKHLEIKVKD